MKLTKAIVAIIGDQCEGKYFSDLITNHAEGLPQEVYLASQQNLPWVY